MRRSLYRFLYSVRVLLQQRVVHLVRARNAGVNAKPRHTQSATDSGCFAVFDVRRSVNLRTPLFFVRRPSSKDDAFPVGIVSDGRPNYAQPAFTAEDFGRYKPLWVQGSKRFYALIDFRIFLAFDVCRAYRRVCFY